MIIWLIESRSLIRKLLISANSSGLRMEKAHVQILSRFDLCLFRPVTDILCWFLHKCRQFFALCDRIYAWTIFYSCTPWLCFFRMPEQYKLNLDAVLVLLEKFHLKLRFDLIWFDRNLRAGQGFRSFIYFLHALREKLLHSVLQVSFTRDFTLTK